LKLERDAARAPRLSERIRALLRGAPRDPIESAAAAYAAAIERAGSKLARVPPVLPFAPITASRPDVARGRRPPDPTG
jgi:hypothetical protein